MRALRSCCSASALILLLAAAACSKDAGTLADAGNPSDAGSGPDAGNDAGAGDAGTDAGPSDAGGSCTAGRTFGGGEASLLASSVTANLVDETGAPIASGQPLYICGLDLCSSPGATPAAGNSTVATNLTEKKPAFKFGDTISYAEFAIPLAAGATDFTTSGTGKIATAKLAGKPGAPLTPGTDAVSGDLTVSLAANTVVGIDTLVYGTADQQLLRAVSIPLTNLGAVIGGVEADAGVPARFGLVFGLAPSETTLCPPAKITVALPAALGWAPNAGVEFWITTTDTGQAFAPYAGWAKMSDGAVSADGKTATTVSGQGFNFLENFAVRLK